MTVVNQILSRLNNINKPQEKFLQVLFATMLTIHSHINFLSLGRHSELSERTFRRRFRRDFDFPAFNRETIRQANCPPLLAFAQDASFIPKSGKHTFGLDKFWNGSHSRVEKGLELSLIAVLDSRTAAAFALSAAQTPPNLARKKDEAGKTRIDFYLEHLRQTAASLPKSVRYGIFDGFYAKQKFVSGVCQLGFQLICRLRRDAHLKYLYRGAQKRRGAKRKYDGKVQLSDLSRFEAVPTTERELALFTQILWSVALKRRVRVVVIKDKKRAVSLFSTDLELPATEIVRLYRSRFWIEFLFRDAKQSAGLSDCQARDKKALEFHWNASFACINLARVVALPEKTSNRPAVFSMKSLKQRFFNERLLNMFISKLGLKQTTLKYQEHYEKLRNYAVIST
jgi:hypothetical protein